MGCFTWAISVTAAASGDWFIGSELKAGKAEALEFCSDAGESGSYAKWCALCECSSNNARNATVQQKKHGHPSKIFAINEGSPPAAISPLSASEVPVPKKSPRLTSVRISRTQRYCRCRLAMLLG